MSTAKEKLQQKIQLIDEFEAVEALNFIEYLEQKRFKEISEALKNAPEIDETLTEEELQALKEADEDVKTGRTLSYEEVFGKDE